MKRGEGFFRATALRDTHLVGPDFSMVHLPKLFRRDATPAERVRSLLVLGGTAVALITAAAELGGFQFGIEHLLPLINTI